MINHLKFVVFGVDGQRYALSLDDVEHIICASEITRISEAPPNVLGVINLHGELVPVLNLRRRLRLTERDITPRDYFLIICISHRTLAVVIDEALGLIEVDQSNFVPANQIVTDIEQLQGLVKLKDGLILIYDFEKFLSFDEVQVLDKAMSSLHHDSEEP